MTKDELKAISAKYSRKKDMTIEDLFGTLQQSVVAIWRKHLRGAKYSKHKALDEFYKEMPDKVDALIEAWMGVNGKKITSFNNIVKSSNMGTLKYLKELRNIVKQGYPLMNGEKELEACLDDIMELIDSTLYKVKELTEGLSLSDYLVEELNEARYIEEDTLQQKIYYIHASANTVKEEQQKIYELLIDEFAKGDIFEFVSVYKRLKGRGTWIFTIETNYYYFGKELSEFLEKHISEVTHNEDAERVPQDFEQSLMDYCIEYSFELD